MSRKPKARVSDEVRGNMILRALSAAFFIGITAVYPLYITSTSYVIITRQKTVFFCVMTGVTAAAVISALFFFTKRFQVKNYFVQNEPKRPLSVSEWALLAFLLLTLLSAVFSPWQNIVWNGYTQNGLTGRWEGFWAFLCYGLTFLIIARFHQPKRLHFLLFAGSAVLLSLYGILQFLGFDFLEKIGFFLPELADPLQERLSFSFRTTLGNVNVVSAYCSLAVVLFAALFAGERSKWGFVYLAASVTAFAMLLVANGDAGKVGVLGAMVLLIPYWLSDRERLGRICAALAGWSAVYAGFHGYMAAMKRNPGSLVRQDQDFLRGFTVQNPVLFAALAAVLLAAGLCLIMFLKKWPGRRIRTAGAIFLAASVVGGLLLVEVMGSRQADQPRNIVWQAREIMHGRMGDNFGSNRGWVWKRGLSVVLDRPLLGSGPDTFFYALGEDLQRESMELYGYTFDKAHNSYLQIAVCVGLPALAAYLVFLGGLFSQAIKRAFNRPLLLACGAAALSFLIQCFFEVDTPIDRPLLWAVLGVMAGEIWRERVGA